MSTAENIEKLIKEFFKVKKSSAVMPVEKDEQILNDALTALGKSKETYSADLQPDVWRIIMKSRITKFAVAAVIVVAVLTGLHFAGSPFGTAVTFAEVIKPIMESHTVVFDFIAGGEGKGPVIHDIVVGNKIRRTMSNMDVIMIIDPDNAKMLTLDPKNKGAVYVDIQGPLKEGTKNFLEFVRKVIADLKDLPTQELGQSNIDGLKAVGFQIKGSNEEITIWADTQTAKPIRIELQLGQAFYVLKNIGFDVPVDEESVSMNVPAGYTQQKTEVDMTEFTEQDFIEGLRIWAEYVLDGSFPENISVEDYLKAAPLVGEKISQLNISAEEGTQLGTAFGQGLIFFQQLAPKGIDYRYVGRGAKFGDAERMVFWYRPEGSQNYRVIYGDLSVQEISPEDLPE